MIHHLHALWHDDAGFIVSAELVLIATLLVIGLIVGFAEIQSSLVAELNDIGDAIGSLNQSFAFSGFSTFKDTGCFAFVSGSAFLDLEDECDDNQCAIGCDEPEPEAPKNGNGNNGGRR